MLRAVVFSGLITATLFGGDLQRAQTLYRETRYDEALQLLADTPKKDASTLQLMGQCYFMTEQYKKATDLFEKSLALASRSSDVEHWLGRTYGRRAETSSVFTAPSYASKARQHFEKAVEYDSGNMEAVNDLFEFYLEAPGFLGGGLDKAGKLANWIEKLDTAEGHYAQARLAEKRKQFDTAEQQLRRAAELAPRQVGRVIDLAQFFAKQGRLQESDAAFQRAAQIDPNSPKLLYHRAEVYIKSGRNLGEAKQLLKKYLESTLTPDDPSRLEAERMLSRIGS
jgi:tetratricopeptide (TPR) repeat protein